MRYIIPFLFVGFFSAVGQNRLSDARSLLNSGRYEEAQRIFEAHLKSHPHNPEALEGLGDVAAHQEKWEKSLEYFSRLREISPDVADHQYKYGGALGMVAKESNKFKALTMISDIREAFQKAIALDPKHIGARWALIELNLQLPAIAGGSIEKAEGYASELLKISPVDGWLAKGRIAEDQKRYKDAERYLIKAVETGRSRTTYQKLADLYTKLNQPEKARATMAEYHKHKK